MPVSIIEQFQLGTNLPLDARYVVSDPYDVSLYWYDGMLIYNEITNQLFVVKDTSTERIVEILDSSSAQIANIDGSISDLYVDQATQDVSIKWLTDNTYTRIYIDGSLNLKVNQTLFDSSISALTIKNANQDTSINDLWVDQKSQDASIVDLRAEDVRQDGSLNALFIEDIRLDGSINALFQDDGRVDASLNVLFVENDIQDASIVALRNEDLRLDASITDLITEDTRIDGSLNLLFQENDTQDSSIVILRADVSTNAFGIATILLDQLSQDASIVALRNEDIRQDGSINLLFQENDIQDASIVALRNEDIRQDGSLNLLFLENDIQDASIIGLRNEDIRQDGSLNLLFLENDIQDASIQRIDASLGDYVRKDGDTMTGPLRIDSSLRVQDNATFLGDVGIGGNLRVDGSTTFIHTDTLDVSINWIHLNTGLTGTPPEWLQSGIVIERGDASAFAFLYDETRQEFRIGIVNETDASGVYEDTDTQAVATREDTPINTGLAIWNGSEWRFDTSTGLTVSTITGLRDDIIIIDGSITYLTNWNTIQDASIVALRNEDIRIDGSLNLLFLENDIQDASIIDLQDWNTTQDSSIVDLRNEDIRQDGSLNLLFLENDIQDASIVALRNEDIRQDGSLNLLFQENDIQDASIIDLQNWNTAQDISIAWLDNNKVDLAGDTMTGDLIVPGVLVQNDLSVNSHLWVGGDTSIMGEICVKQTAHIDSKIHMHPYTNVDASWGDLWIEPSTYNLFYKHPLLSGTIDASSYDLTDRLLRTADDWNAFPDSSTLDNGDRILIEDAQAGYAKKWISAQAFAASATALLYPSYTDFLPEQNTTSITYIDALTLTSDPSAKTSTYRIAWTLQIANSKVGKDSFYRILLDGSIVEEAAIASFTANAYSNWSGFQYNALTIDPSGHKISVQYASTTGSTAYIRNIRLEFRKADTAD